MVTRFVQISTRTSFMEMRIERYIFQKQIPDFQKTFRHLTNEVWNQIRCVQFLVLFFTWLYMERGSFLSKGIIKDQMSRSKHSTVSPFYR